MITKDTSNMFYSNFFNKLEEEAADGMTIEEIEDRISAIIDDIAALRSEMAEEDPGPEERDNYENEIESLEMELETLENKKKEMSGEIKEAILHEKKKRKKKSHRKLTSPAKKGKKGSKKQYRTFKACSSGWDADVCDGQSPSEWGKMTKKWEKEGIFHLKKK